MRRGWLNQRSLLTGAVVLLLITSQLPASWLKPVTVNLASVQSTLLSPGLILLRMVTPEPQVTPGALPTGNEQVSEQLADARNLIRRLELENERLTRQIEALSKVRQQIQGGQLVTSSVVEWNGDSRRPQLTINQGSSAGIQPGQTVVASHFLVGQVTAAGRRNATVQLVTMPGHPLHVRFIGPAVTDEAASGTEATMEYDRKLDAFVSLLPLNADVKQGDLAHLQTGNFRAAKQFWQPDANGLPLAIVTKVEAYPDDPQNQIRVLAKSALPLEQLTEVVVSVQEVPAGGGS